MFTAHKFSSDQVAVLRIQVHLSLKSRQVSRGLYSKVAAETWLHKTAVLLGLKNKRSKVCSG